MQDEKDKAMLKFTEAAKNACPQLNRLYNFTCPLCGCKYAAAMITAGEGMMKAMMAECPECGRALTIDGGE